MMDNLPKLSDFIVVLRKDGHQWHTLNDGCEAIQFRLTKENIDFLKPAIPKEVLLYRRGPFTGKAFRITLVEKIYSKFFDPSYEFKIRYSLAPALCILAAATQKALSLKKPSTKNQDYNKLAEMQKRFANNEFPKSITIRYPGRDDSYTLSDQEIMLEFWEAFLKNTASIQVYDDSINNPVNIELVLFNALHPVVKSKGNTCQLIVDLFNICGNKEPINAGAIAKRIERQNQTKG